MRPIKHFFKRLKRFFELHQASDRTFIVNSLKPFISIFAIFMICVFCSKYGISWVLNRLAILGIIVGLLWWGKIFKD